MFGIIFILKEAYVDNEIKILYDLRLLICDLWKKEFRGNFGAILDIPGIRNEGKS